MKVVRWAKLDVPVDLASIRKEVAGLPARWTAHFQKSHTVGDWTVLPLRTLGGDADEALPFALGTSSREYRATPLLAQCPAVARFIDALGAPVMSARLLKLAPGATIKAHRDPDLAFESGEARLHVPILTNPDVEFLIDGQRVAMEAGTCWYINANLRHQVANRGSSDRIHLVVDCAVDDGMRRLFARAERAYSEVRRSPAELRQMIDLLRAIDTPASLALVAALEEELAGRG